MSELTQYTPGPWRVGSKAFKVLAGEYDSLIADVSACCRCRNQESRWFDTESAKANARLIAAAPELLEALKFLVSAALTEPGMSIYTAHIRQAQIIIQKAGGATHE